MDKEMMKALQADGEKLRQLTGEDHGPWIPVEEPCDHPDCEFPMCDCEHNSSADGSAATERNDG